MQNGEQVQRKMALEIYRGLLYHFIKKEMKQDAHL
jgi:hypothetical protein